MMSSTMNNKTITVYYTHPTMLGWLSSFSNEISLMAVEGTPSHSLRGERENERESQCGKRHFAQCIYNFQKDS